MHPDFCNYDPEQEVREAVNKVKRTKAGKIFIEKLLKACRVEQHSFVPGDPYATAFHCGQQSIGFWVKDILGEK